nr:TonB-dependent receptor [uncultured Dyadobacter sp.]
MQAVASGSIRGKVRTASGEPASFVNVSVKETGRGASANEQGEFLIEDVPAGRQTLVVSGVGFETLEQKITVRGEQITTADITLQPATGALSEVTVLGQKRKVASVTQSDVPLLDLPLSVQVVDQTLMQQQQIIDVRDAIKAVSGVTNTGTYAGGYADFNSRGFAMNTSSNFRRDGVMLDNISHLYNDNIEQMEVLKGPTSVMYGDISPGAVMNFVTKKPLDYDYKRFEMKIGQYGLFRPSFDLSGPVNAKKTLLYRINTSFETSKSFIDFIHNKTIMFTPSLTWKIAPSLEWNVEAVFKTDDRTHNPGMLSADGTFAGLKKVPYTRFLGEPSNQFRYRESSVYSTLSWQFAPGWRLKNTTYFTDYQNLVEGVYFRTYVPDSAGNINRSSWMTNWFSQGWGSNLFVNGQVKTGPVAHNLVVGADYMINRQFPNAVVSQPDLILNLYNPVYSATGLLKNTSYRKMPGEISYLDRLGIYAQDQITALRDKVHVLLGLRYNITSNGTRYNAQFPAPDGYVADEKKVFSPRIGLLIKPRQWLSVYGSYSQSYEQNGRDWMTGQVIPATDASQFEVGAKASFLSDRLGIGLAAFDIQKENVFGYVYGLSGPPEFAYFNYDEGTGIASYLGAHHQSKGIEVDLNGKITPELNVNIAASYINATIVRDPAFASGNRLGGAPRTTVNIWANYAFSHGSLKGFEVGYGFFSKGKYFATSENLSDEEVDPFWTMDVSVGYKYKQFFTRLNVSNFTDNRGYLGSVIYEPLWVRRAVLSIGVKF